jgi:hypothetical protein
MEKFFNEAKDYLLFDKTIRWNRYPDCGGKKDLIMTSPLVTGILFVLID